MPAPAWDDYLTQLARLPGGAKAALTDFLGPWLAHPLPAAEETCWRLRQGGRLCLKPVDEALLLVHEHGADVVEIARFGLELLEGAARGQTSPMLLALLAIAAGDVDDARRLKQRLPGLDGAARDLMLMTLCRLCG